MMIHHEGSAYFYTGSPVLEKKGDRPHIAIRHGYWFNSINGRWVDVRDAGRWVKARNKSEERINPEV